MRFLSRAFRLLLIAGWLGIGLAQAELPFARLNSVFPPGGQSGQTVEVTVAGADLDDADAMLFSHAGIMAESVNNTAFKVTISSDVPPGLYEARVAGRFGLTNPRAFQIGSRPEVMEKGPNHGLTEAQAIPLGHVVNGRTDANARDHYKFNATSGQRVLVSCLAEPLDSRLQPVLVIYNGEGRELGRSRRGGLLGFTAPQDGEYVVQVQDALYRGGGEFFYRLCVHEDPQVDFIVPPCGLPGSKGRYTVYGRNLPGGKPAEGFGEGVQGLEALEVDIELPALDAFAAAHPGWPSGEPASASVRWIEWRLTAGGKTSNPVKIGASTAPVIIETEPNDDPDRAQEIKVPAEYVGQFYPARDRDWLTFEAAKDESYWIEVFSERLGLPTHPFVLVQRVTRNDKGEAKGSDVKELYESEVNLGGREFNTSTKDPLWRFDVKESGTYRILIRDLFSHAAHSPAHLYRLAIRKASPDYTLAAVAEQPLPTKGDDRNLQPWSLFLRRGESWPVKVMAFRLDDFNAPIDVTIEGLPPGVACAGGRIEAGQSTVLVYLTAAADAPDWHGSIRVTGHARVGEETWTREACGGSLVWGVGDYNNEPLVARLSAGLCLAVGSAESAAVTVSPSEAKIWQAPVESTLEVPITVIRQAEFNEALKLKVVGLGALDKMKEFDVDNKTTNTTLKIDLKEFKVPAGTYQIALRALTKGKYRNQPEAADAADAASKEADKAAAEAAESVKTTAKGLEEATAKAKEAQDRAKVALEKFETAKTTGESSATAEAVALARQEAEKASQAAAAEARQLAETVEAASKAKSEAETRVKETEAGKKQAADVAKSAKERAKPRDVIFTVYSAPIQFEVQPAEEAKKE